MSPSSPQHEPTMEEILASIRKIISEDSPDTQPAPTPPTVQAKVEEAPHDADVLELTQVVHEELSPAAEPEHVPEPPAPVIAAAPQPEEPVVDDVEFQPIEETPMNSPVPPPLSSGEGIFSDKTRQALSDAFTNLDPEPEARPAPALAAPIAPLDGHTIEAVFDHAVRQAFDPVLQNWLDQHADAVVERMKPVITQWLEDRLTPQLEQWVRDEVALVAKQRARR